MLDERMVLFPPIVIAYYYIIPSFKTSPKSSTGSLLPWYEEPKFGRLIHPSWENLLGLSAGAKKHLRTVTFQEIL